MLIHVGLDVSAHRGAVFTLSGLGKQSAVFCPGGNVRHLLSEALVSGLHLLMLLVLTLDVVNTLPLTLIPMALTLIPMV